MATAERLGMASGSTTANNRMGVHMKITIENNDKVARQVQDKLKHVLQLKLESNTCVVQTSAVDTFWKALTDKSRMVVNISYDEGSLVFIMDCPTVEAQQDLEKCCGSGGRLVQLVQRILSDDQRFREFIKHVINVSANVKRDQAAPAPVQPAPATQTQETPESLRDQELTVPAQQPAPAAQAKDTMGIKEKCERIEKEMVEELADEQPRLLGPGGLGGIGVNVMMEAYLRKWKILNDDDLQDVTNEMLTNMKKAKNLLKFLQARHAKELIMFAHVLKELQLDHQLDCLKKKENRWIFEKTDEEMLALLKTIYPG